MGEITDPDRGAEPGAGRNSTSRSEVEARYHGIMETTPDLIFILDGTGNIIEANPAASEKLEYSAHELVGKRLRSFFDSGSLAAAPRDKAGRYGSVSETRAVLRARRGIAIPVEIWTTARFNGIGEFSGSLTIARPVDGPADCLEQFKNVQHMFEAVSNAMKIGVSIHNAAYVVTFQNDYLRKCYPNGVGDKCFRVYRGLEGPCENCIVREAMVTGKTLTEIVAGPSPDGRRLYFEMVGVPVSDDNGRITGGFEIIRDLTDLKAELEKLHQFEKTGADREAITISGEVNQPLSGISGYSELLRDSVARNDPAYRYATKIYEQSQRLTDLIQKINKTQTIQRDNRREPD